MSKSVCLTDRVVNYSTVNSYVPMNIFLSHANRSQIRMRIWRIRSGFRIRIFSYLEFIKKTIFACERNIFACERNIFAWNAIVTGKPEHRLHAPFDYGRIAACYFILIFKWNLWNSHQIWSECIILSSDKLNQNIFIWLRIVRKKSPKPRSGVRG